MKMVEGGRNVPPHGVKGAKLDVQPRPAQVNTGILGKPPRIVDGDPAVKSLVEVGSEEQLLPGSSLPSLWERACKKIDIIERTDPHRVPIDPGVRDTVIGLNASGFTTTMSCEGHEDRGSAYPFIKVTSLEALTYERAASKAFVAEESTMSHDLLQEKANEANEVVRAQLNEVLGSFYRERHVPPEIKLVAEYGGGRVRLRSSGSLVQAEIPPAERFKNLVRFQKEMREFGDYLKRRFFGNDALSFA